MVIGECSLLTAYPSGLMAQANWFGLKFGGHLALFLHSLHELGKLSQCSKHDNSIMKIILVIIIIIKQQFN